MESAEAPRVAALHRAGIPQGFLSRLNPGVRTELYRGIALAPRSGVWVAANPDDGIVGFIAGTAHLGLCYREVLMRRGCRMGLFVIPDLVRVATWRHLWETLLYPKREVTDARRRDDCNEAEPTAELLAIVVAPEARGSGAAKRLVDTLESALVSWRCRGPYRVVTMSADPQSNAFYVKVGFRRVRPFVHHGIAMNLYHKDLAADGE
jgi:GNAT superfamily N-acetyltransferase